MINSGVCPSCGATIYFVPDTPAFGTCPHYPPLEVQMKHRKKQNPKRSVKENG